MNWRRAGIRVGLAVAWIALSGAFPGAFSCTFPGTLPIAVSGTFARALSPAPIHAQSHPSIAAFEAPPSRADSLLARGRLRAAEDALYAAVAATPSAPAARGALGRYLASRGKFRIAEVLLTEALRFGADSSAIARALTATVPYREGVDRRRIPGASLRGPAAAREAARTARERKPNAASGAAPGAAPGEASGAVSGAAVLASVPFTFSEDGRTLGRFAVRGRGGRLVMATLDPRTTGVAVRGVAEAPVESESFGTAASGAPLLVKELSIGTHRLAWVDGTVNPDVPPGELRLGLDVLWRLGFVIDERAGTLTVGHGDARVAGGVTRIPFVLTFPGVVLIPRPGVAPIALEDARARALLRGTRWWLDVEQGTLVVER